jgi:hypothetical protein
MEGGVVARIRSLKPEFPQSESMGRVSRDARLLFILLWPICDDHGRTRAASILLASLLFPYDKDAPKLIEGWLKELEREGCIRRYVVDGSSYLEVCNWLKHQKIDKPSKPVFPGPENAREDSRGLGEDSGLEGKGREGKGEEGRGDEPQPPNCPHQAIVDLYHEVLPELRSVREWNDERQGFLRERWRDDPKRQNLDWWRGFFEYVSKSDWLMGRKNGSNGRPFDCDLEWLVRPTNFAKVLEGKYEQ